MSLEALNDLMREGNASSGAYLLADAKQTDQLFLALKETPGVAGLTIKRTAVESFRSTFAQSMNTVLFFYVGFAGMITFGVVYNAARISLSERARDLATLRVLGFSKRETAAILLGEFALLTLTALPIGWMFGYGMATYMVARFATELYRIPLVVTSATLSFAALTAIGAAIVSGFLVARRIIRLDLVAVLKTRD
jgi:putative ABC transport system permease protein